MAKLKHVFIGVLVFSLVVTALFIFLQENVDTYGVTVDENYTVVYNQINQSIDDTYDLTKSLQEKVEGGEGVTLGDTAIGIGKTALSAIFLPFEALKIMLTLISSTATLIGIPSWIMKGLLGILIGVVAFMVLSFLFRFNG